MITGDSDGGSLGAWHDMGAEAETLNFGANLSDILLGGLRTHDDEHETSVTTARSQRAVQNVNRSCNSSRRLSAFSEKPSPLSVPAV